MTVTLADLRSRAKQRADMENSSFIEDAEWNVMINSSVAELHDILIAAQGEDYKLESYEFTTVSGTDEYNLPDDFYKLCGVDVKLSDNTFYTIKKFNRNERNRFSQSGVWEVYGAPMMRYRLWGSKLKLTPIPDAARVVRMWYQPKSVELVNDADEFDDINAYSEYVVVDVAIKALTKEESDVQVLLLQKEALRQRLIQMSQNRDVGESESVSDIYAENADQLYTNRS